MKTDNLSASICVYLRLKNKPNRENFLGFTACPEKKILKKLPGKAPGEKERL
ncbi:hypothetical protein NG798_07165 [Ancylothrix sp. C2]|nr:hypothetical protein [Ancylothrix sp. D3o]